ncbi:uncharacterized protein [Parasteatoda tepidariorum]|uniref:uncharacterized protein n=1 Tax=Parasteatoda tepidariorum TaxID=114398 RepID=UPI001C721CB6|nr:uncharacterized protein LOC122268336 [Parasteatoda tepidariorum]
MSKETQVSMFVENYNSHSLIQEEKIDNSGCKKMNENKSENESLNCSLEQQLAAVTSKVENLMNVFNNHVMKSESFAENKPLNNSSNNERPIHTRDVSLQFSPYLVNRSVHTSPIRTLEKANQCTNYLESNQTKKQYLSVSTQAAAASQSEAEIKKSATVATQSDCAVTIDNWMQTLEVPEHSNNSSVSVTPVSDSPFLDDILSEGEIPFHLKFLSFHDRAANLNSTVAESSEEKDYSLSEGEIHPQYLQSSYNFPVSTDHFNKGAHSFATLSQLKSPTEKTLNFVDSSTSEASLSRLGQNARQINFSTPIWNPENSPQLHSSGEIPSHCFSSSKRSFHDVKQMEKPFDGMKKAGISVKDSNNYYHYRTAYQMPDKNISPSNLSSLSSLDNSN